jgi:threonine synthase
MKFVSTKGLAPAVSFMEAMRIGLAPDGGLYMPERIPKLPSGFWNHLTTKSFHEIAVEMAGPYLEDELSAETIQAVVKDAFNFPVHLKEVEEGIHVLELFHGPTLAFKDFGARFMARLFAEQADKEGKDVTILVATSGDTGSAVANGFYNVAGVSVCLLYPKGKVSPLQEKQMTTLGNNITALEVNGVFDDCQKMVKEAFGDQDLSKKLTLSSANSINIARLLPQSFYYVYALAELQKKRLGSPVFSIPSGNFGNLTGALLAGRMGMPVHHLVAATNINDVVPKYLHGNPFKPKPSVQTISNAMDVGNPSNFERMKMLFDGDDAKLRRQISGYSFSDEETRRTIRDVYEKTGYVLDPHTAVGYRAVQARKNSEKENRHPAVIAGTAHPVKFRDIVSEEIGEEIEIPQRLKAALQKEKKSITMENEYAQFREFLMERFS